MLRSVTYLLLLASFSTTAAATPLDTAKTPLSLPITASLTYAQLRDSAAKFSAHKAYDTAFALLTTGMARVYRPYHNDLYDAADFAILCGWKDTSLYYLKQLIAEGEFEMISHDVETDPDFTDLRRTDGYARMYRSMGEAKLEKEFRLRSALFNSVHYRDSLVEWQDTTLSNILATPHSGPGLLSVLQQYNHYPSVHPGRIQVFTVPINDSTQSYYLVVLPENYRPDHRYPLLVVLHGAVFMNRGFPEPFNIQKYPQQDTAGFNRFFTRFSAETGTIVVYPHANRAFNWMYPDDGFPMIPRIITDLKHMFNVDDNRVYISGHSNGATGVVSYLLKEPSAFAGFYGFNSLPRVSTGGTFIRNALNRSYFNVSTDKDYYFPLSGHDTLTHIATRLGIDWQNHTYYGFPHWFPDFEESKPAFALMFADMARRPRNPFRADLYWECDDVAHGRCDWLSIDRLDTAAAPAPWQTRINFTATHWVNNMDTSKVSDTVITAFRFPRRSGAVKAHYASNRFELTASRVSAITLFISPSMVDMAKPVSVWVNGREVYHHLVAYDQAFMVRTFRATFDRKAVWVNRIQLEL
jgi:dienelactone hydrolase